MPTTRKRGAAAAVVTLGLLLNGALAGCSISKDDSDKRDTSSAPRSTPTPTASEQPTTTPTPTPSPTASSSAPTTPAPQPKAALLTASEVPAFNEAFEWKQGATAPAGPTSFGLCQQFDTLSIGAVSAIERSFTSVGSDVTAGQQIAEFPDAQNTVRAAKVLEAWQRDCKKKVLDKMSSVRNAKVGPITEVAVPKGKGWYYIVTYAQRGKGHVHELGVTYNGHRMSLLKMDLSAQDHDFPPGQDPMELAVKAASAKM